MLNWWIILLLLIYCGVCLALMAIILLQAGKGGGLSSLGQAAGGIKDTVGATSMEKAFNKFTTIVAVCFMVFAIGLSLLGKTLSKKSESDQIFKQSDASSPVSGQGGGVVLTPQPAGVDDSVDSPMTLDLDQVIRGAEFDANTLPLIPRSASDQPPDNPPPAADQLPDNPPL